MEARESVLSSPALGDIKDIRPIIQPGMSDSASLDNVLEFFVMSGLSPAPCHGDAGTRIVQTTKTLSVKS